jgi:hypothetical protein
VPSRRRETNDSCGATGADKRVLGSFSFISSATHKPISAPILTEVVMFNGLEGLNCCNGPRAGWLMNKSGLYPVLACSQAYPLTIPFVVIAA